MDSARDAFCPPDSWLPKPSQPPAPEGAAGPDAAEGFTRKHTLQAVMVSAKGPQAVINGTCLAIGQSMDGFRLLSAGEQSATLVSPAGLRVTLELPAARSTSSE